MPYSMVAEPHNISTLMTIARKSSAPNFKQAHNATQQKSKTPPHQHKKGSAPTFEIANKDAYSPLRETPKYDRNPSESCIGSQSVENAVELLSNPVSDQSVKEQAFEYLNQLRSDPQGWQVCTNLFVRVPRKSEVVRMVCLEVVNYAVHTQGFDRESLNLLKHTLLQYVRQAYSTEPQQEPDQTHLQNKLTQTLTYLFVFLYRDGWESFIDDFLDLTGLSRNVDNVAGVLFYLRVLSSVHDEIADMLLARESNEAKRNTELKDQLRAQDMQKVAESWKQLLIKYGGNDVVVDLVLKVVGKWVSWMDISLVINQDMLSLLLPVVGRTGVDDKVRDTAIDTLTEICGKKMRSSDKMEMISFLNLQDIVSQLVGSPMLNDTKGTAHYDIDLAEVIAKLVNTIVADIIKALDDNQANEETRARAKQHLDGFLPLLLRFFADEYDEICSTVIPALTDLLTFLRKSEQLNQDYRGMLPPILNAIIRKMRYDETTMWGNEDEQTDEAEFQELRKRLQILQKTIAAIDQGLYMEVLSSLVANTFQTLDQQGSHMDWRDLDLALHMMYLFGELALPNQGLGSKNQPSPEASERLVVMMQKMVESGIANFSHPAILLQYMEICNRYCAVFETHSQYIPQVLENFVRLVHHNHVRIKTRSWYLFHRVIKQLRSRVGNVAETVIQSIGDLLPIKAEMPGEDADDDMSSDESDHSADALFTSQLYLFEAIGCISSTSSTPPDKQALYVRSVMDPLFQDMEVHLPRAKSGDAQAALQIHHIVMALGTLAHGFSDWAPSSSGTSSQHAPPDKLVSTEFSRAAEAILIALREVNSSSEIRTACRSAFSKLLGVLGAAVLPQLPQWIEGLLSQSSSKDEMAMFLRLLDQVVFGFKAEIYDVLNMLLTPLLQRIFGGLSEPITGTDDEIQLAELRREYLSFIQIILHNGLEGVLVSEANQGFFEPMISSIIELGKTLDGNIGPSRLAFTIMMRMSTLWGGPDVATISQNPTAPTGSPNPAIPGFDRFMIDRFHSTCWEVIRNPGLRPSHDAQTKQVLTEIAGLEQVIYTKTGDMFIQQMQNEVFPSLGINGDEFLRTLTTSTDKRRLSSYLQGLMNNRH
ncbi:Exportin-T [Cladobotryum mycophilum]|uniref:Exportin-T n=1 Tax=Cladobotryum mycophilum TaxID=491253 RepID=A0ABR0SCM2_9HYPO